MTRARAYGILACAVLLVLAQVSSVGAGPVDHWRPLDVTAAPTADAAVVRQAYDALLDRFIAPLDPAAVLRSAAEGAVARAAETGPGDWPTLSLPQGASRDAAWDVYQAWFEDLSALAAPVVGRTDLEQAALKAMAAGVKERHTRYLTVAQYEQYQASRRADIRYVGVGTRLRGPDSTVIEVYEDSPAERAGLRAGDTVLEVDGLPTAGASPTAIAERLRGEAGESVELLVERQGMARPLRMVVTRADVRVPYVRSRLLFDAGGRRMGYLQVRGFPRPAVDDEIGQALSEFQAAGIEGLVIDLRGNGGGRIDVGTRTASRFVREGTLYRQVDRAGRARAVARSGEATAPAVPVSILTDGGTASMGEIFSAALQEAGVARIIGTRTAGSVAGAQTIPLADGSALQVTVLAITSRSGTVLNQVGVQPDEVVEPTTEELRAGIDVQLEAALRYLRAAAGERTGTAARATSRELDYWDEAA